MAAASGVAVVAAVAKAASVPVALAVQPVVVNLMPVGNGWLQYMKVIGTLVIALIAAAIAGTIQYRQMKIASGALRTAASKLTLDLFDRRLAIFDAAEALIRDDYPETIDDIDAARQLRDRMQGARWLLNPEAAVLLNEFGKQAYDRIREEEVDASAMTFEERADLRKKVVRERIERKRKDMKVLTELFDPFLSIKH